MRILGIDPGMAIVGYSIIDVEGDAYSLFASGSIQTDKSLAESARLLEIFEDITELIATYKPDCASVEKLFFFKNQKTVMPVAEARGVIILALERAGVSIAEYTPMVVKQALTGYGRASKDDVARCVSVSLCNLGQKSLPKLDDTVDSMAIAICHAKMSDERVVALSAGGV